MKLLLIRHGLAEDPERFRLAGGNDAERPLTELGIRRLRKGANRLRALMPTLDVLVSSRLLRARESADIVARAYGYGEVQTLDGLAPEDPPTMLLAWLAAQPAGATVALVGHQPHLGRLAGLLLCGEARPCIGLRKGGAALIEFAGIAETGSGVLGWLLTARQLRGLRAA